MLTLIYYRHLIMLLKMPTKTGMPAAHPFAEEEREMDATRTAAHENLPMPVVDRLSDIRDTGRPPPMRCAEASPSARFPLLPRLSV